MQANADNLDLGLAQLGTREVLALVYAGEEDAHRWQLIAALRNTILKISSLGSEAASLQLSWWQDEILRLDAAQPRHPLTRELARIDQQRRADPVWLNEYLTEVRARLHGEAAQTDEESRLRLFRTYGIGVMQMHALGTAPAPAPANALTRIGIALGLQAALEHSNTQASNPAESLLPATFANKDKEPRTVALAARIDDELGVSGELRTGIRTLDLLTELIRFDNRRLRAGQSPAPLRRSLFAWRIARQLEKHYARNRQTLSSR